ncbi:hypothetical protein GOBAR_AA24352 [Gossypium barbadense]|uniref:Uncharacterized protein n=1 Tax=Gossypium barbadense TaxID=3634 RepID=A0A2P5WYZ5_GOSBA|nr:hypothetical protein GOBAR_AA24352 [Gossypium barbadense]
MDKKLSYSSNRLSSLASISSSSFLSGRNVVLRRSHLPKISTAKELNFNKEGSAIKKLQTGVNKLADLVGVTLEPNGRNLVLESKYGSSKIVNNGVTVAKEVELDNPVVGAKLVRQVAAQTNDLAGDGTTTSMVAASANPVLIIRGIEKTTRALVSELKAISKEVILILICFHVFCILLFEGNIISVLWDIVILTGGTIIRDEVRLSLDKASKEVLGHASKVDYEKEKLDEKIAKLLSGVAVIQVTTS